MAWTSRVAIEIYVDAVLEIQSEGRHPTGREVGRRVGDSRQAAEHMIRKALRLGLVTIGPPPNQRARSEIGLAELWERAEAVRLARPEDVEETEADPLTVLDWLREWQAGDVSRSFRKIGRENKSSIPSGDPLRPIRHGQHSDRRRIQNHHPKGM